MHLIGEPKWQLVLTSPVEQYDNMVLPSVPIWQQPFVQPWQLLLPPRALKLRQGTKQESLSFPTVHITMGCPFKFKDSK